MLFLYVFWSSLSSQSQTNHWTVGRNKKNARTMGWRSRCNQWKHAIKRFSAHFQCEILIERLWLRRFLRLIKKSFNVDIVEVAHFNHNDVFRLLRTVKVWVKFIFNAIALDELLQNKLNAMEECSSFDCWFAFNAKHEHWNYRIILRLLKLCVRSEPADVETNGCTRMPSIKLIIH